MWNSAPYWKSLKSKSSLIRNVINMGHWVIPSSQQHAKIDYSPACLMFIKCTSQKVHKKLQCRVTVFFVQCVQIPLLVLTYLDYVETCTEFFTSMNVNNF